MGDVITRKYLLNRYAVISKAFEAQVWAMLLERSDGTETEESMVAEFGKLIRAEEDRQIREGIKTTIESNMKHNNKYRRMNSEGFIAA